MSSYQRLYNVALLDDIHNFFPALLYDQTRFLTITDIFRYVNTQMNTHFNLFSRGYNEYVRANPAFVLPTSIPRSVGIPTTAPPIRTASRTQQQTSTPQRNRVDFTTTTETIDITPLFSTYFATQTPTQRTTPTQQTTQPPQHSGGVLIEALMSLLGNPLEPVAVRPTPEEISDATGLRLAVRADEQEVCAICQERYTEGQAIRTVNHCGHAFHKGCIDPWFERNVHCPVCRHDIRQSEADTTDL